MKIYQVGGAVRDRLLGRPIKDRDWVVVGATPEEMLELGYRQVGKDFPVFLHPKTNEEYALARTERKTAPGYTGFCFDTGSEVTLEEDLARRDLTVNAMAMDADGNITDPYGGRKDLERKLLRHVSPAFAEDPVRILRAGVFTARLGFEIAPETVELMREMADNGEVDALVPERVWQELEKALSAPYPVRFFDLLQLCGARRKLFPELDRLFGIPQPAHHHPEIDTGLHVMMVLEQAARLSTDPKVRFAALCHDLGKGNTPEQEWPSHHGHEERGAALVKELCLRYRIPNDYRDLAVITARFHLHCHRVGELRPATLVKLFKEMDIFRRSERLEPFLLACEADYRGRTGFEERPYPHAERFRRACTAAASVNAQELVDSGLKGKRVGQKLHRLRVEAVNLALWQESQ